METPIHADHPRLALLDALFHVPPLSRHLDRRLYGLYTGVHGEDHVVPEHLGHLLRIGSQVGRMEGTGRERAEVGLGDEGGEETGVTVTLVDGAVGGEHVDVFVALWVPDSVLPEKEDQ